MNLKFQKVTKENWTDLEALFESKGGPHSYWCSVWRPDKCDKPLFGKAQKKESLKNYVQEGIPVGILAYASSDPIAWCSIAPRESHKKLGGDDSLFDVWALTCFFIKREYRSRGISIQMIDAAVKYAESEGANFVEAYPVAVDSPSYRFMGFVPTFEKVGFEFQKTAGKRRNVMLYSVSKATTEDSIDL